MATPTLKKSRLMDEQLLSYKVIELSREKANDIYQKIRSQQDLKDKMADQQRFY
jgi:hypothetical protein